MNHRHASYILLAIVIGVAAGLLSGWYVGEDMKSVMWLGTLFLNALKMTILPLIVAAVITGIASVGDVRKLGRLGGATVLYYAITTGIAAVIGLVLVNLIQPGAGIELAGGQGATPESVAGKEHTGLKDIFLTLISPNLVESAANLDLLPIILFSVIFGAALTIVPGGNKVIGLFGVMNEVMMKIVSWLMYFAPIGIFALVAGRLGQAGGGEAFLNELQAVSMHVVTVLTGLGVHFVLMLLITLLVARVGIRFLLTMLRALLTAFGTASSSATLPITMESAREAGLNEKAVQFTIPLGSTINMHGTALYESAAAMFIAQAYGLELGLGEQAIIFITATLAAIGAAGIPEAGLVTMVIVLKAVDLPLEGIGLLLSVDWFLDRFRTLVNVWGDAVGAAVIDRLIRLGIISVDRVEEAGDEAAALAPE